MVLEQTYQGLIAMFDLAPAALSTVALHAIVERLPESEQRELDAVLAEIDTEIALVLAGEPKALERLTQSLVPVYLLLSLRIHSMGDQQFVTDIVVEITESVLQAEFREMPDELNDYMTTVSKSLVAIQKAVGKHGSPEEFAEVEELIKEARQSDSPFDALVESVDGDERAIGLLHALSLTVVVADGHRMGHAMDKLLPLAEEAASKVLAAVRLVEEDLGVRIDVFVDDTPEERGRRALRLMERMRTMWDEDDWREYHLAVTGE